jgi:hypothetical protein
MLIIIIIAAFTGCSRESTSRETFGIEEFENAMKDKGYDYEIKDAKQDFLQAPRKRMIIDKTAIEIYLFRSSKKLEKEAGYISSDGCSYTNGSRSLNVSWVSFPHFYKKGSLIVQYVGEDEKIISDLTDIFGEQFAGYTQ